MTNQEKLPVWAQILLGVPVNDEMQPDHSEGKGPPNSSKREAGPSGSAATEQSVITFGEAERERKWNWKTALCPSHACKGWTE
jgi:hypothetical protein